MKIVLSILSVVGISYILLMLIYYVLQRKFIYKPSDQDFDSCVGFKDYQKQEINTTRFYYRKVDKVDDAKTAVVFYHGNEGSACDLAEIKHFFEPYSTSILFVEYSGFSNQYQVSKKNIHQNVKDVVKFLNDNNYKKVIVFGQSLGSAVASYHAQIDEVDLLVLLTPFLSLEKVIKRIVPFLPTSLLLTQDYDNLELLREYTGKVVIFHGNQDQEVPYQDSKLLYQQLQTQQKQYHLIDGAHHRNVWSQEEYKMKYSKLMEDFFDI